MIVAGHICRLFLWQQEAENKITVCYPACYIHAQMMSAAAAAGLRSDGIFYDKLFIFCGSSLPKFLSFSGM
jgi:hypothetical protein